MCSKYGHLWVDTTYRRRLAYKKAYLKNVHSGVLAKCSFIRAYSQNVPSFGRTRKIFLHLGVLANCFFFRAYVEIAVLRRSVWSLQA